MLLLFLSNELDLPRRPMYWEHNEETHNTTISSLLSRKRFDEIMQNLQLAASSNLNKGGKFVKMRPLIDKLNKQRYASYLPEQSDRIDESMVPYFSCHGCKQVYEKKTGKMCLQILGSCDSAWLRDSVLSECWKG